MLIVGAYIVVAIIIFITVWTIMRRRSKKTKPGWSLRKEFDALTALQLQLISG